MKPDGTQIFKIHLREEDRRIAEPKAPALALVYKKLTNKILAFEFVKTSADKPKKERKERRDPSKAPVPAESKKDE